MDPGFNALDILANVAALEAAEVPEEAAPDGAAPEAAAVLAVPDFQPNLVDLLVERSLTRGDLSPRRVKLNIAKGDLRQGTIPQFQALYRLHGRKRDASFLDINQENQVHWLGIHVTKDNRYSVSSGFEDYVALHGLTVGDTVRIYQSHNADIEFVIDFDRLPQAGAEE